MKDSINPEGLVSGAKWFPVSCFHSAPSPPECELAGKQSPCSMFHVYPPLHLQTSTKPELFLEATQTFYGEFGLQKIIYEERRQVVSLAHGLLVVLVLTTEVSTTMSHSIGRKRAILELQRQETSFGEAVRRVLFYQKEV